MLQYSFFVFVFCSCVEMESLRPVDRFIDLYRLIHEKVTWKVAIVTAGVGGATYTLYCFLVKPFLSPLRKV